MISKFKHLLLISSLLLLSGCTLVPGMHMRSQHDFTPSVNANGQAVTPTITPITAQLILKQHITAKDELDQKIKNYVAPKGFTTNTKNYSYQIGRQDVLAITVWNHPSLNIPTLNSAPTTASSTGLSTSTSVTGTPLTAQYTVNNQGDIYYPYVGNLKVIGLTVGQVRDKLAKALSQYVKNPQLNVTVTGFHSQRVEITGAVKKSETIPITNVPLTVLRAVTTAGGPIRCGVSTLSGTSGSQTSVCADITNVKVTHDGVTSLVNLNSLQAVNHSSDNWLLQSGDLVYVPNNNLYRVFILGAVKKTGPFNMTDGKMTLREAIGDAGGVSYTADPTYTYIIRNYKDHPQIFELNARSPDALNLAGEFALKPEDILFVSTSKLENFNAIINQFLPSLSTAVYIKSLGG